MKPAFQFRGPVKDETTMIVAPALGRPNAKQRKTRLIGYERTLACDCCATVEEFTERHLPDGVPEIPE